MTYQWYSNTINSNSGGTPISGATAASYSPSTAASGTFYYYCVIGASGNGCGSISTNVSILNVTPNNTASAAS